MKRLKKWIAFVISMIMVISTISMSSLADNGNLPVDGQIKITGLTNGDTVNLFKVLKWVDGEGWRIADGFESLVKDAQGAQGANFSKGVQDLVDNKAGTQLSADDLALIAKAAQGKTPVNSKTLNGTTEYVFTTGTADTAGMYIALVTAAEAGTVYNPIVISADFTSTNGTDTIPASSVINGTAVAKKKKITFEKIEPKITNDVGDTFEYEIKTTIPVYSSAFTNKFFTVTDELSEYLDLDAASITVLDTDAQSTVASGDYKLTTETHGFTLTFEDSYIGKLPKAKNITIKYKATLNVPVEKLTNVKEEKNEVTVSFPNNPNDLTGKKVTALKDGTREYTFTIDGKLFGNSSWQTGELVKVGLDANGSPVEAVINVSNGSSHAALQGAKFGLYTTEDAAKAAGKETDPARWETGLYKNTVFNGFVTTDSLGLMEIQGLDVGTYWLIELDAPDGYIKDQTAHKVEITADINGDEAGETGEAITEYYTVDEQGVVTWHKTQVTGSIPYTYYVPVLNSYTVTVDGNKSSYKMTLDGPNVSEVTPAESSTEIANTKGVELPSTGGMGTTIFYIIGSILVVGAGILLVTRRRMSEM